ncbi:hypothetical protein [Coleofasciculus sp. G2-EDA-02]|uniref:hypothetical protein n=1 Tax=Coleofasciculus sp. G2-EDA-02 TaxID=3069529 RepID=UPI0032FBEECF
MTVVGAGFTTILSDLTLMCLNPPQLSFERENAWTNDKQQMWQQISPEVVTNDK